MANKKALTIVIVIVVIVVIAVLFFAMQQESTKENISATQSGTSEKATSAELIPATVGEQLPDVEVTTNPIEDIYVNPFDR